MGKNPHIINDHNLLYLSIKAIIMIKEVKKRELNDIGMAMLAVIVIFVLLLNLLTLFEII